MKIHISEILPTCDSELTLTNIGSHNVEHVIDLIRTLVKVTEQKCLSTTKKPIEITDSMLTQNGWEYKYGFFEGPFKINANLSSPTSSKRAYRAILEDGRVLPIKYISDIQHILAELGNSKIVIPGDE